MIGTDPNEWTQGGERVAEESRQEIQDSTTEFSGWTNASLTGVTEIVDFTESNGDGGGIGAAVGVKATAADFFPDLPARVADAHLIIARSGASTVAELAAIGRPAILVPLPHALDQDQLANAAALAAAGGALLIRQSDFTSERLSQELAVLLADPVKLSAMAAASRKVGRADAAERLADEVMRVARLV